MKPINNPLLVFLLVFVSISCKKTPTKEGHLVIKDLSQQELASQLKTFKGYQKLTLSYTSAKEGWSVFPPFSAFDSIFFTSEKKTLPSEIKELTSLKTLRLSLIELTELPVEISSLVNLDTLDLSLNYLQISKELDKLAPLKNLKYLNLLNNQIDTIQLEKWMNDRPDITVIYQFAK